MSDYLTHKPGSLEEVVAKATQQESGYQDKFKKELEKTGRGIGSMTPKEKTAFFTKLDKMHKAKNEEDAYDKDDEKPKTKPKKLAASYEEKDVPKGSHKMPDGTIMKDKDHKKEGLESVVPPKNKEQDEKDLKRKTTMTGEKPTEIDTKPQIKY
ncbi:hypothetical protein N8956_00635 [bacterium]|jgi:hypothetical protein|nr:hypothetical protein [bacterium]